MSTKIAVAVCTAWLLAACGSSGPGKAISALPGSSVLFELDGALDTRDRFYNFPYPADLRLTSSGTPDLRGLPLAEGNLLIPGLVTIAQQRPGYPVTPVAYFRFSAPLREQRPPQDVAASADAPLLLVDLGDDESRGTLFPLVVTTPPEDGYVPANLLAVGVRPGIVLSPGRRYAFVVMRSMEDAAGQLLGSPLALEQIKKGQQPVGALGGRALAELSPLWDVLGELGVARAAVAAATVFTTGDVVAELSRISQAVVDVHDARISELKLDPSDGDHPRYCELLGQLELPQFQLGKPPFNEQGLFEVSADGIPQKQRDVTVPVVITIPKKPMPPQGYPLTLYVHGSGGEAGQLVDRGAKPGKGLPKRKGEGPAHVLAPFGIAMAGAAMPVNPERLPGASSFSYLNFSNLASFRDIFRQGVIETRLLFEALGKLEIEPAVLAECSGATLPAGVERFKFAGDKVGLMGQSMGGMYTNLVGAVEPRIGAIVPTGAGGHFSLFVLLTPQLGEILVRRLVGTGERLSFLHPALHLMQTAWEPVDPVAFAPRISQRPLEGHSPRHVYQPVGKDDEYFPTEIYDAMALSFGHRQAGDLVWSSMQQALALSGLGGVVGYPVELNMRALDGRQYTGIVVQYEGDGIADPHAIAFQLDAVKRQYGTFLDTYFHGGRAQVIAP